MIQKRFKNKTARTIKDLWKQNIRTKFNQSEKLIDTSYNIYKTIVISVQIILMYYLYVSQSQLTKEVTLLSQNTINANALSIRKSFEFIIKL